MDFPFQKHKQRGDFHENQRMEFLKTHPVFFISVTQRFDVSHVSCIINLECLCCDNILHNCNVIRSLFQAYDIPPRHDLSTGLLDLLLHNGGSRK